MRVKDEYNSTMTHSRTHPFVIVQPITMVSASFDINSRFYMPLYAAFLRRLLSTLRSP
jgi:hypothetical protein